jgi:cellulose synthase/poly-beta-1,6-N-acetylglucosamine synthase-like glycosyltransferase
MKLLFWATAIFATYAFIGYAGLMWVLARVRPKPVNKRPIRPKVSIVMAVHNGGSVLAAKLKNFSELTYPKDLVELVVASDGSTDITANILNSAPQVKTVLCPRVGKAEALNRALAESSNEIVVFTDVRQRIETDAIAELVANFADENVGCVSGELMFSPAMGSNLSGVSAYWQLEKLIRKCESDSGSVIGATGALYAVRRSLIRPLPPGTLLDDVYIPLHVLREGKRVIFEPNARVWDELSPGTGLEFRRKVRTLAGNFQMLELAPWAITDGAVWFRFVSHKFTRLLAPWLLLVMFFSAWGLAGSTLFYLVLAIVQSIFYGVALAVAMVPGLKCRLLTSSAKAFCLMNIAAAVAVFSYARHRRDLRRIWITLGAPASNGRKGNQPGVATLGRQ